MIIMIISWLNDDIKTVTVKFLMFQIIKIPFRLTINQDMTPQKGLLSGIADWKVAI